MVDSGTRSFRPIAVRPGDTCETQRAAAAHNSVYDTLKDGKKRVYCSPCDCPELYELPPATDTPAKEAPAGETS